MPEEGKKRPDPESGLASGSSRGERGPISSGAFGGSYRALLDRVSDMVTISDREGRIVYANPATERVSGYSPEEFVARNPFDSIHPEDRPRCEEAFGRLRNTPGLSLDLEHRFRHKDGSWRWAQGTFEGLFDDPEIGGLVATVRDVTEKKRAEEALRESEERQAFLLELSDALRAQPDEDAIADFAIRKLAEELGVDRCYIAEMDAAADRADIPYQFVRPGFAPVPTQFRMSDFLEVLRQIREQTQVLNDAAEEPGLSDSEKQTLAAMNFGAYVAATLRRGERNPIWALLAVSAEPRRWTPGEVRLIEEVSERTWAAVQRARAEAGLRDSEAKYRTLFDAIDEGFCVFELVYDEAGQAVDYRFLEVNRVFERQTGLENAVGKLGSEIAPNKESHWLEVYDNVARTGEPLRLENYNQSTERWYEAYASRVGGADSRRVCTVFNDITERKEVEAKLRESKEKQVFLLKLGDAIRPLADPTEIKEAASRLLGEHLAVDRAAYAEFLPHGEKVVTEGGWRRAGVSPGAGTYRAVDFGAFFGNLRDGTTATIEDTLTDPGTPPGTYEHTWELIGVRAAIVHPVVKRGRLVAAFFVHSREPRRWLESEATLVVEVGDCTWEAVERARAEEASRASEERYRTLVENVGGHAVFLLDADGRVAEWTVSARRVMGYSAEEVTGRHVSLFYTPEEIEARDPDRELEEAAREGRAEREGWRAKKDGTRIWVNEVATAVRDAGGDLLGFAKISRDLTERRELEEEREIFRARELTFLAEVAERERISRELHDRVAHHMGVAHQFLELFAALREADPERAQERLDLARETTRRALDQTRALSAALKRLQEEELKEGLEAAFGKFAGSYVPDGTEMDVSFSGEESAVPGPVGTQVYLAMREAVRNAVRHSGCSRIGLTLEVVDEELHGLVEDDGEGFEVGAVAKATPSWGVGLRSMRERAEMLGGSLRVDSEPGVGTRVELRVPLNGRNP